MVKVKQETRWFVNCPECDKECDVDSYESGTIECEACACLFDFDNVNPENAEVV